MNRVTALRKSRQDWPQVGHVYFQTESSASRVANMLDARGTNYKMFFSEYYEAWIVLWRRET